MWLRGTETSPFYPFWKRGKEGEKKGELKK